MIHPWPMSDAQAEVMKQAKARIDTPIKIIPVQGGPGGKDRVLCLGSLPSYLCRVIPVAPANALNVESVEKALRFFLDPWRDESRWNEDFILGAWMGAEVRFLHEEDETGKVMFA